MGFGGSVVKRTLGEEEEEWNLDQVVESDLIDYGLIPEFIGNHRPSPPLHPPTIQFLIKQFILSRYQSAGGVSQLVSGRVPLVVAVNKLTESELVQILSEPKNSLVQQYKQLFSAWNIQLEFSSESLRFIARQVLNRRSGARGLRFAVVYRACAVDC